MWKFKASGFIIQFLNHHYRVHWRDKLLTSLILTGCTSIEPNNTMNCLKYNGSCLKVLNISHCQFGDEHIASLIDVVVKNLTSLEIFHVIYQTWDAVFHHQMRHREESWKYDARRSIFDELQGVSSGKETLCRMFDISSQTKSFFKEKLRMQKWAVFHPISKHSLNINFLWIFFMNY